MAAPLARNQDASELRDIRFDPRKILQELGKYSGQKRKLRDFIVDFTETTEEPGVPTGNAGRGKRKSAKNVTKVAKYRNAVSELSKGAKVLDVSVDDILSFFGCPEGEYYYKPDVPDKALDVLNTVMANTKRTVKLLYDVVEEVRKEFFPPERGSVSDLENAMQDRIGAALTLPTSFRVPYEIRLIPPTKMKPIPIYKLRAEDIGTLSKINGVVSRISSVKPCISVAVYRCDDCGQYEFQYVATPSYTPLTNCTSQACKAARRSDTLTISMRDSRFIRRQEVMIQEMQDLVPSGTVPQQIKVVLTGEMTKILRPGMQVTVGGVYLPVVDGGYRHPMASSALPTFFEAHHVALHATSYEGNAADSVSEDELQKIIAETPNLYELLAASVAPAIHGHDDVKKALLLQLVSGATESFGEGLKIRGDIHMLIMGDPGIAKSQMLLRVCAVAPRAHFTCGKGSSGVGLTASVVKDPVTGEFTLEGGAIVLADNGICCVDEFDKMQESDRTAIHEVMEQQTVSISKAGLIATLNARTTILAAANPIFGRYDINKSAVANIGLPAALLSRFDVIFLLLDQAGDYEKDYRMAKHLLRMHQKKCVDEVELSNGVRARPLSNVQLRAFIARARRHVPKLTKELAEDIAEQYVVLRQRDRLERGSTSENTYTTPRSLFALLRMSQAVARIRFSDTIEACDFEEALRIMQESKKSVTTTRLAANGNDPATLGSLERAKMLTLLRTMNETRLRGRGPWIKFAQACEQAEAEGLSASLVEEVVESLVHAGTVTWDGPQKKKFSFEVDAE